MKIAFFPFTFPQLKHTQPFKHQIKYIQTNHQMSPPYTNLFESDKKINLSDRVHKLKITYHTFTGRSQKIGLVVGSHPLSMSLPLFIENRTGSCILPSLYVSTSIHRKQDWQLDLTLSPSLYLYSQKIGQVVVSYPRSMSLPLFIENRAGSWILPSLYVPTFIHRKQDLQLDLTLSLCIYLYCLLPQKAVASGKT